MNLNQHIIEFCFNVRCMQVHQNKIITIGWIYMNYFEFINYYITFTAKLTLKNIYIWHILKTQRFKICA